MRRPSLPVVRQLAPSGTAWVRLRRSGRYHRRDQRRDAHDIAHPHALFIVVTRHIGEPFLLDGKQGRDIFALAALCNGLAAVIETFADGMPASNPLVQQEMQDMENLLR